MGTVGANVAAAGAEGVGAEEDVERVARMRFLEFDIGR